MVRFIEKKKKKIGQQNIISYKNRNDKNMKSASLNG